MRIIRDVFYGLAFCLLTVSPHTAIAFTDATKPPISIDVTVDPHGGAPVSGLTKDDFTILNNGKQQEITAFKSDKDNAGQTEAILVLDAVNMPYDRMAFAKQEIIKYLQANNGRLAYPTDLAIVTDQSVKMQGVYTTDGNLLAQNLTQTDVGIRGLGNTGGAYGATDRIAISIRALHELLAKANNAQGRKLMIWISPGWPILSGPEAALQPQEENRIYAEINQLSYLLRGTRTVLYSVDPLGSAAVGTFHDFYYKSFLKPAKHPSGVTFGNISLQVLAISSGGMVLNGNNDIPAMIESAVKVADPVYTLSFSTPVSSKPDEFHSIEVKVNKPGITAKTGWGYYTRQ